MINAQSKVIGIFGYPIHHSKSPQMHNYVFDKLNLGYVYVPFNTPPEQLKLGIEGFKALGFHGANITIPYKSKVIPFLDEVSELGMLTESVNTLYWKDGKLRGNTTDGYGALRNLKEHGVDLNGKVIAILGNGGSSRAITFQIAKDIPDCKIYVVSRKLGRGQLLVDQLNDYRNKIAKATTFDRFDEIKEEVDIIINTTPVGLGPDLESSPLSEQELLPKHTVYDIIYNPLYTKLLRLAEEKGCKVVTGIGMLIYQGMRSWEYWTGKEAKEELFFESLKDFIK